MEDFIVYYSRRKYIWYIFIYTVFILVAIYKIFDLNSNKEKLILLGVIFTFIILLFIEVKNIKKNKGKGKFILSKNGIYTEFHGFKSWKNMKDVRLIFKGGVMAKGFVVYLVITLRGNQKIDISLDDANIGYFK